MLFTRRSALGGVCRLRRLHRRVVLVVGSTALRGLIGLRRPLASSLHLVIRLPVGRRIAASPRRSLGFVLLVVGVMAGHVVGRYRIMSAIVSTGRRRRRLGTRRIGRASTATTKFGLLWCRHMVVVPSRAAAPRKPGNDFVDFEIARGVNRHVLGPARQQPRGGHRRAAHRPACRRRRRPARASAGARILTAERGRQPISCRARFIMSAMRSWSAAAFSWRAAARSCVHWF
jgi:hypothetical protein